MKKLSLLAIAVAALGLTLSAQAHEVSYSAALDGPSEAPPNTSTATGSVVVDVDLDLLTMRIRADFQGLSGNVTAAHIHCCTTTPLTGTAGVAVNSPSLTGFPLGVKAGAYDKTFDLTLATTYSTAFINASGPNGTGGTVSDAMNRLLLGFDNKVAYLNIHTSSFPGGEIRGFLQPVPVPGALALFAPAIAGLALRRRQAA